MRKGRNEKRFCICGSEIQSNVYASLLATRHFKIRCTLLQKRHTRILRVKTEYLMRCGQAIGGGIFKCISIVSYWKSHVLTDSVGTS